MLWFWCYMLMTPPRIHMLSLLSWYCTSSETFIKSSHACSVAIYVLKDKLEKPNRNRTNWTDRPAQCFNCIRETFSALFITSLRLWWFLLFGQWMAQWSGIYDAAFTAIWQALVDYLTLLKDIHFKEMDSLIQISLFHV